MRYSTQQGTTLSLLVAGVLMVLGGCVSDTGPLGAPNVIVVEAVAAVTITLGQSTLTTGQNTQAAVAARTSDGKNVSGHIDFLSQNPSVATVTASGVVTAVAAGAAVIQATVAGCVGITSVTVQALLSPVAVVAVAVDSLTLTIGHVARATAVAKDAAGNPVTGQTVTWASLAPTVATVSSTGAVAAVGAGSATIQGTVSGTSGSASLTVLQVPVSVATVTVSVDSTTLRVGHSSQASAIAKDASGNTISGRTVTWTSLSPSIATVSSSGVVTAAAAGPATVKATVSGTAGTTAFLVVTPPDLASWDFNDGTLGPIYTNPYAGQTPGNLDFIDDPTGSGRGKVARFEYVHVTSPDKNRALSYVHTIGYGQTLYFAGDLYLPVADLNLPLNAGRKLLYWQPHSLQSKYGAERHIYSVFGVMNKTFQIWISNEDATVVLANIGSVGAVTENTWYRIEKRLTMQSSYNVADGQVQIWINGVLGYDSGPTLAFIPPSWIGQPVPGGNGTLLDPADLYFQTLLVGQQVNDNTLSMFDEFRYWDNVAFSTKRIGY